MYNTLFLLQLRISKLFKGGKFSDFIKSVLRLELFLMTLYKQTSLEKFDDIKFGKVLTKLYARMFTMEGVKYLPPKFSYALRDLAEFLGIFEITEDQIKRRGGDLSDTSSNISYVT